MRNLNKTFFLGLAALLLAACGDFWSSPPPFPTPGGQDLVVLTRPGPLTYTADDDGNGGASGLEHDLAEEFAHELGVGVKFKVVAPGDFESQLDGKGYHIAAAWLSPNPNPDIRATPALFRTHDVLAQDEASLPLTDTTQLAGKTVYAIAGTRQAQTVHQLAEKIPGLKVAEVGQGDILDLLDRLGDGQVEYVAMDAKLEDIANQFVPTLRTTLKLNDDQPIVWQLGAHPNPELAAKAKAFVERIQQDGTLARLEDRYFGHVRRLNQIDIVKFLGEIETTLPRLRKLFQQAEAETGLDWRLIAAVSYQESHWNANATSPTGVRGIMMLTDETADRLKVDNRLDVAQAIPAGARYIKMIKDTLPTSIPEPDRTWEALAAYNLGPGHFNGARAIAHNLGRNPDNWYDIKRTLPLLAKPKYYDRLKAGKARGGEAVILVENIRSYYDILVRNEAPYQPFKLTKADEPKKTSYRHHHRHRKVISASAK